MDACTCVMISARGYVFVLLSWIDIFVQKVCWLNFEHVSFELSVRVMAMVNLRSKDYRFFPFLENNCCC